MGEYGLTRRRSHKTYSIKFKLDVLQYKLRTEESYQDVTLKFDIHEPSIIANWMRIWRNESIDGFSKPKGCPSMSRRKKQKKNDTTSTDSKGIDNPLLPSEGKVGPYEELIDARNIFIKEGLYTLEIRSGLLEVIKLNKTKYPNTFDKQ